MTYTIGIIALTLALIEKLTKITLLATVIIFAVVAGVVIAVIGRRKK